MFDFPFPLPHPAIGLCVTEGETGWDVLVFRDVLSWLMHGAGAELELGADFVVAANFDSFIDAISYANSPRISVVYAANWGKKS